MFTRAYACTSSKPVSLKVRWIRRIYWWRTVNSHSIEKLPDKDRPIGSLEVNESWTIKRHVLLHGIDPITGILTSWAWSWLKRKMGAQLLWGLDCNREGIIFISEIVKHQKNMNYSVCRPCRGACPRAWLGCFWRCLTSDSALAQHKLLYYTPNLASPIQDAQATPRKEEDNHWHSSTETGESLKQKVVK